MKYCYFYKTPFGNIAITAKENYITNVAFKDIPEEAVIEETPMLQEAFSQLSEYLSGKRKSFKLSLNPEGTIFQKRVWDELQKIPYGQTRSYQQIACAIGNVSAVRAVGMAIRKNPLLILIPCHRVIGANGSLRGYSGGVYLKQKLLDLEKRYALL